MKTVIYYDIRYLLPLPDHAENEKIGWYEPAYSGEQYIRFSRQVHPPCLPVRGQVYHLKFDPLVEASLAKGDYTQMCVEQSGFVEEDNRVVPYFIVSHVNYLECWVSEKELKLLTQLQKIARLEEEATKERNSLIFRFKKAGWKCETEA